MFSKLHKKYRTPHIGIVFLTLLSAAIGGYGVLNVNNLTQVTLMSNIGTFVFYGLTCLVTLVATLDHLLDEGKTNPITTIGIPLCGAILNFAMLVAVFYFGFTSGGDSAKNAQIAIGGGVIFFIIGFAYIFLKRLINGKPILLSPDTSHPLRDRLQ